MEDTSLELTPVLPPAAVVSEQPPVLEPLLAPWWHTVALLAVLGAWAMLGSHRIASYTSTPHWITYVSQMLLTWVVLGAAVAGIYSRSAFFFNTLQRRAKSFIVDGASGLAIYMSFASTLAVIAMIFVLSSTLYARHHTPPSASPASQTQTSAHAAPTDADPLIPAPITPSRFHLDQTTARAIAPRNWGELLLWIGLSFTAAFCEEHIFRGYILTQAVAILRHARFAPWLATGVSILVTSLLFGSLHLYEGLGGALIITFLSVVYCIISIKLGNLRAVIAAHFLQDFLAGALLFALRHHSIP